jgi:hypothetical protein
MGEQKKVRVRVFALSVDNAGPAAGVVLEVLAENHGVLSALACAKVSRV